MSIATVTLTFNLVSNHSYTKVLVGDEHIHLSEIANEVMSVLEDVNIDHNNREATFVGTTATSLAIVSSKVYGNPYAASRIKRLQYTLEV